MCHVLSEAVLRNLPQLDAAILTTRDHLVLIERIEIKVNHWTSMAIASVNSVTTLWFSRIDNGKGTPSTLLVVTFQPIKAPNK